MPPTKGKVVAGLFNIKSKETKMTYQDLFNALSKMTPEQLQCDLTVEIVLDYGLNECFPAELKICGIEHGVLDEDHPVIFVGN